MTTDTKQKVPVENVYCPECGRHGLGRVGGICICGLGKLEKDFTVLGNKKPEKEREIIEEKLLRETNNVSPPPARSAQQEFNEVRKPAVNSVFFSKEVSSSPEQIKEFKEGLEKMMEYPPIPPKPELTGNKSNDMKNLAAYYTENWEALTEDYIGHGRQYLMKRWGISGSTASVYIARMESGSKFRIADKSDRSSSPVIMIDCASLESGINEVIGDFEGSYQNDEFARGIVFGMRLISRMLKIVKGRALIVNG